MATPMIRVLLACLGLGAGALLPTAAHGQGQPPVVKLVEPSSLRVFHDGKGHYLVVPDLPKVLKMPYKRRRVMRTQVFYGSRKVLYKQYTNSSSRNGPKFTVGITDGRAQYPSHSMFFHFPNGGAYFQCLTRRKGLAELPHGEAQRLLKTAVFRGIFWKREAYLLARDDNGRYFYVDVRAPDRSNNPAWAQQVKGLRFWVGQRGRMKRLQLRNIVSDAAGLILITPQGKLKVQGGRRAMKNFEWITAPKPRSKRCAKCPCPCAAKPLALTQVPLKKTTRARTMVYQDLGAYIGVKFQKPCDVW